ncbi:DUF3048 domain-containing protein [Halalkalibacterium ligniniphilum]|uniref:DUF3048 domain-containing protein n=1 Tax=Halalkalibacterium ligniniphilum TaxID=1134413 RepID=UPI00034DC377|nr:DUF3048 domain-containing protein [Halalkalibacterium ligniniphilum]
MVKHVIRSLFFTTLLVIAACGNEEEPIEIEETPEAVATAGDDITISEPEPAFTSPLTGLKSAEPLNHRVIGVTISNHSNARPQSGLQAADIIYEVLAEGEITRFVALYHSQYPERVGPVRSVRPYHIDLVQGYDGLLVTHGWSPAAEQMLTTGRADYLNGLHYDGTLFERSQDRRAPHNSYIRFANIQKGLTDRGYTLSGDVEPLEYVDSESVISGIDANEVTINYSSRYQVTYRLNEETGRYSRYNGEAQTVDDDTKTPIEISNLLIVEMNHRVLDDAGRREINVASGGRGMLVQAGKGQYVEWRQEDGRILPFVDGKVVPFLPGQTWINIIPTALGLDESVAIENE